MKKMMAAGLMMLVWVGMAQATLTNDGVTASQVTAVNGAYAQNAAMKPWGNWWIDWTRTYNWASSIAYISWNLPTTEGSTYDFSGATIAVDAMNSTRAGSVGVVLCKSGAEVWSSDVDALGSLATHTWTVPTDIAYNGIDEIKFKFQDTNDGSGWGTDVGAMVATVTSTATPTPEPATLGLLGLGGLLLRRKK